MEVVMKSFAEELFEPWIPTENLPQLSRDFSVSRDLMVAKQIRDLDKTEAQRRGEQSGGNSSADKPDHLMQPPPEVRNPVIRSEFEGRWLAAQRDAVLVQSKTRPFKDERPHEHQYARNGPSR
jgi:hypothetical protein